MLTNERIRSEALRQLDTDFDRCTDRLPSLEELEVAALAELAADEAEADRNDNRPSDDVSPD